MLGKPHPEKDQIGSADELISLDELGRSVPLLKLRVRSFEVRGNTDPRWMIA